MNNIFDKNLDTNEKNCVKFIVRSPDSDLKNKIEEVENRKTQLQTASVPPLLLRIVSLLIMATGLVFLFFLEALLESHSFSEVLSSYGWVFYTTIACNAIGIVVVIFNAIKFRPDVQGLKNCTTEKDALFDKQMTELGVPDYAEYIDVMYRPYKIRNGKTKYCKFHVSCLKVFKDDKNLYFADGDGLVAIPLDSIQDAVKIKKLTSLSNRTEDDLRKKNSEYQKANLKLAFNMLLTGSYYSVRLNSSGEQYEIDIPPYELEKFLKYVNIGIAQ